jgi:MFS family permease
MKDATGRLGALAERNFRLLFTSTTISALGDGVAIIALAFAVLQVSDSPVALGVVIAGRQVAQTAIVLAAGVWSDRLPRHLVLFAAAAVQGVAQALSGSLVLSGHAGIPTLAALQVVYGLANGFVIPASQGLIPHTVTAGRLQDANALLGLTRNMTGIGGPALGGVLVAAGSPGAALLVDAASFGVEALLLLRLRIAPRDDVVETQPFFAELREGWSAFRRQTWIWTTIVFFGIGNFVAASYFVLGPVVAKRDLGGPTAWAIFTSCFGIGAVLGSIVALRIKPQRPLLTSCLAAFPVVLPPVGVALKLPVPVTAASSVLAGMGIAVHLAFWFTVFQQQVPENMRARVSSYDALGSFVLIPLGSALAGPVAELIGITATLIGSSVVSTLCIAIVSSQPSVRAIRDVQPVVAAA